MADQIKIEVDSSQIDTATEALDRLASAAERAMAALKALGDTPVILHRVGDVEAMQVGEAKTFAHETQD